MKSVEDSNLERGRQPGAARRRYEPPRLTTETVDVRGTSKTNTSILDQHNSTIQSGS